MDETPSLKALADAVLRRAGSRDVAETEVAHDMRKAETREVAAATTRKTLSAPHIDDGSIAAVLIRSSVVGGSVWLASDLGALDRYVDIEKSGLPVFLFSEVERLRTLSGDDLRALAGVKRSFPRARILQ